MGTGRIIKTYDCPYCGNTNHNNTWTYDHIIAQEIGGPKGFKIICCEECNHKIGREIELTALRTSTLQNLLGRSFLDGYNIHLKRKKRVVPVYKGIGMVAGRPARMYYDLENKRLDMSVFGKQIDDGLLNAGCAIFPEDEECSKDLEALTALAAKIALGTCQWLWKTNFICTNVANNYREMVWNSDIETIEVMKPDDNHLTWVPSGYDKGKNDFVGSDALDNRPNHTIGIFQTSIGLVSLVNLFGFYESMSFSRSNDCEFFFKDDPGIIVIAKTTENKVTVYNYQEYIQMKSSQLNVPLKIKEFSDKGL